MNEPNPNPVDGPTELVIVTFGTPTLRCSGKIVSDLDWLRYSLKSIKRHLTGFQGVTIVHPRHEIEMFKPLLDQFDIRLHAFDETPGKGMIGHMCEMAKADTYLPAATKYVLHTDSDCVFKMATRPEHYFWNDKPYYIVRSWESLTEDDPRNPGTRVVSDCLQWREPTERQLGFKTPVYTMCMNAGVFPIDFYKRYRDHIESVHRKPFEAYMLEGKSVHPATRMDWTAFGSYAYYQLRDRFHWFFVEDGGYPEDRKSTWWSHGGLDDEIRSQIEKLIA